MKARCSNRGVAMILVLWIVLILSMLVAGFAFMMEVETRLASLGRKTLKASVLARAGVEVAQMQLMLDLRDPAEAGFDSMTQAWATNELLYVDHELGGGKYNVRVFDEESKLPINRLTAEQIRRTIELLDIDPFDGNVIADSIVDWIDDNDLHQLNGAESEYYESLDPPYAPKNGPLDRVEELLLIRGVTREIYDGISANEEEGDPGRPGLRDIFTTTSSGIVNVNTASGIVLAGLLDLNEAQIDAVLNRRNGGDGILGTEDDMAFQNLDDFFTMLGPLEPRERQRMQRMVGISSAYFTVKSVGEFADIRSEVNATLRREGGNVYIVNWQEGRPKQ